MSLHKLERHNVKREETERGQGKKCMQVFVFAWTLFAQ